MLDKLIYSVCSLLLLTKPLDGIVVGIMATDEPELGNIVCNFEGPVNKYTKGMKTFYRGNLWGRETVIVLSNVGKVAAACAAVDLINEGVDYIVLIGTTGALDTRLNVGDVVIVENLFEIDLQDQAFPPANSYSQKSNKYFFEPAFLTMAQNASKEFFKTEWHAEMNPATHIQIKNNDPKVIQATIGTCDKFLLSEEDLDLLNNTIPSVMAIDMESAAVAQVATNYQIPYVIIRIVSNYIDRDMESFLEYNLFLERVQAIYTKNILKNLFANIHLINKKPITPQIVNEYSDVGILCKSDEQLASLLKLLGDNFHIREVGNHKFYKGLIGKFRVTIAATRFGKSNVAEVGEAMILNDQVKLLLEVGKANRVDDCLENGDLVISSSLIEYDVDVRPFRPQFELPTIGITHLPASHQLTQLAFKINQTPHVHLGLIASGDRWLNRKERLELKQLLPNVLCVDSDSASAAQIAYQSNVSFLSIKSIAEDDLTDTGVDEAVLHLLKVFFEKLEKNDFLNPSINILENSIINI